MLDDENGRGSPLVEAVPAWTASEHSDEHAGIQVGDRQALLEMAVFLLSRAREIPVIGLACSPEGGEPILSPAAVRRATDRSARIYCFTSDPLLDELEEHLGAALALRPSSARVWWPGLTRLSHPYEHPIVGPLDGLSELDAVEELASDFDLSRPRVRAYVRQLEDTNTYMERECGDGPNPASWMVPMMRARRAQPGESVQSSILRAVLRAEAPLLRGDVERELDGVGAREIEEALTELRALDVIQLHGGTVTATPSLRRLHSLGVVSA